MQKLYSILFVSIFISFPPAFAEPRLIDQEAEILSSLGDDGPDLPEPLRQSYPFLLMSTYGSRTLALDHLSLFRNSLETALLFGARNEIVDPELRSRIDEAMNHATDPSVMTTLQNEIASRAKLSPRALSIQSRVNSAYESLRTQIGQLPESDPPGDTKKKGQFYVLWGYNRAIFTRTNSTFVTPEGTFTIHGSKGYDRPSPFDPKVYFNPTQLSIPQYNIQIGYMINDRWGIEIGQDHMKWVFDPNQKYDITGSFSPTLYTTNPNQPNAQPVAQTFDQIKQSGDATWLHFEHTNGYNYPHIGVVYQQPIYHTPKNKFAVDARFGAGAGLFVPQTSVYMQRDQMWNWKGYDNQFHIAGGGFHGTTSLKLTFFDHIFLLATARGSVIKVNDALVDQSGARLMQTPIGALELIGQVGYQGHLGSGKRKKKTSPGTPN
ncbi:MAG: hypothetical protein EBX52_08445 [Proteobacteria bacterium]|nr:hypothetical protein [Pseudomonadota bacterium]